MSKTCFSWLPPVCFSQNARFPDDRGVWGLVSRAATTATARERDPRVALSGCSSAQEETSAPYVSEYSGFGGAPTARTVH